MERIWGITDHWPHCNYSCRAKTRKMGFNLNKKEKKNKISTVCLEVCLTFCGNLLSDCNCKFKLSTFKSNKNGHYCTRRKRRSQGKADGKQNQAFSVLLHCSWQVPSAHRSSLSSQTATFRSYQSGFKRCILGRQCHLATLYDRERKHKQTESQKRH